MNTTVTYIAKLYVSYDCAITGVYTAYGANPGKLPGCILEHHGCIEQHFREMMWIFISL